MKKAEESTVPTNNKKVEVHDATEKTTDVTPKQTETEHEKQVLTGTLAQKAARVSQALTKAADMYAKERAMVEKAPLLPTGTPLPGRSFQLNNGEISYGSNRVRDWQTIPQLPERSELTDELAMQKKDRAGAESGIRGFQMLAPKVLGGAGNLIGGPVAGAFGKLTGQGLGIAAGLGEAAKNTSELRYAMTEDAGPRPHEYYPAPAPKPAPQLPVGQPRPPVAQPPRGLGSAGLNKAGNDNAALLALLKQWEAGGGSQSAYPMAANSAPMKQLPPELAAALQSHLKLPGKTQPDELDAAETMLNLEGGGLGAPQAMPQKAGAFSFGTKIANGWMGLNSSRNGPGGVISTKTLPKADATAKNWGPAGQLPPPSRGTTVAVPSSAQQSNGMKPITPGAFGKGIFNKMQ